MHVKPEKPSLGFLHTLPLFFFFFTPPKKVTFNSQGSPLAIAHILRTHAWAQHSQRGAPTGPSGSLAPPPYPPRPGPEAAGASPPYLLINRQEHPPQPERWWRGSQSHEPSSVVCRVDLGLFGGGRKVFPASPPSPPPFIKKRERERESKRKRKEIEQGCARCRVGEGRGVFFVKKKKMERRESDREDAGSGETSSTKKEDA